MDLKDINYLDYGTNKNGIIVLLHGWGQNIQMMDMLGKPFEKNFRIINIDFPGFGDSKEPDRALNASEYMEIIHWLLGKLKVKNPILIGHSFGGRVSIAYASKYETKQVILLSSPFRPENRKLPIKVRIYKFVKKVGILKPLASYLQKAWGSSDYNNASGVMRNSLVKIVNEDLTKNAKNIKCPVLLIYGKKDDTVKITEAQELEKIIEDAGLVVYENGTHYAYLEEINRTIAIINSFIKGDL